VFSAPQAEVELLLSNLEKFEIIQYDKHKDKPQLTFLTGRYDAQQLPLQVQDIEQRRAYDVQKALAVKHYIEHQKRCRTQLLLEYFDEHTDATCGVCDVCIKKNEKKILTSKNYNTSFKHKKK
jgi:ATP-dependent DNA helicase RecQ